MAVVFKITRFEEPELTVLAWQRVRDPYQGAWALPSGPVLEGETIGACVARNLAAKVDLSEIAHLEQLETRSDPGRDPFQRTIATAYLGLVPSTADPRLPANADWIRADRLPAMAFDHASVVQSAVQRLEHKLSYSNIGFGLAPAEFTLAQLRDIYRAALGYDVSVTNLQRVLQRRGQLEPTGRTAPAGGSGGRPAALYRFTRRSLQITDPFAAFRPERFQRD
ncbi:MAG: NUDIX domain-containing protein [Microlunatus sp.]|nr:NUDIX domain-containing protein [Microlunatus sp.]